MRKQVLIAHHVRPGMTCLDVGANVGFYTLLFSSLCGDSGKVVAFEPHAGNCAILRRHLELNSCGNAEIRQLALADFDGSARFEESQCNSMMGKISPAGKLDVECRRLDTLVETGVVPAPDVLKIDVEGAEEMVLLGSSRVLTTSRAILFLATHGAAAHTACIGLLKDRGYEVWSIDDLPLERSSELMARAKK